MLPLLSGALRLWTPLAFAALGGVLSERAGVVALGLEGMMLAGAFSAVVATSSYGSFAGLFASLIAGALVGLLHAFATQNLRVPGVLSGVALNLGLAGLTTFAVRMRPEGVTTHATIPGEWLTGVAILLTALLWFTLYRTPYGLRLRACGENPHAALSAGLPITRIRWTATLLCGAIAGLGGAALSLPGLGEFTENMTAGRGYIALAAVIFGRWNPLLAALAALLFGFGDALQLHLQTAGFSALVPADLLNLLPYILTLAILAGRRGGSDAPAAL